MTTAESNVQCGGDFRGIHGAKEEHSETMSLGYEHGEKSRPEAQH